jgi:phosphoadenosine phosphosulfate reductase
MHGVNITESEFSDTESALNVDDLDAAVARIPSLVVRLQMIAEMFPGRRAFSTSLGLEDQVLLHALVASGVAVDVFTLDTGRHFPETLETLAATEAALGIRITVVSPDAAEAQTLVARDGIFGFRDSVAARKACCDVRKVRPLNRYLSGASVWFTGLRREQSAGRQTVRFVERDDALQLVKANPLADWLAPALHAYVAEHGVPVNPLHARGYPSIGCQPCTRAVAPGEPDRAGRWWWEQDNKKECGLHFGSPREAVS